MVRVTRWLVLAPARIFTPEVVRASEDEDELELDEEELDEEPEPEDPSELGALLDPDELDELEEPDPLDDEELVSEDEPPARKAPCAQPC